MRSKICVFFIFFPCSKQFLRNNEYLKQHLSTFNLKNKVKTVTNVNRNGKALSVDSFDKQGFLVKQYHIEDTGILLRWNALSKYHFIEYLQTDVACATNEIHHFYDHKNRIMFKEHIHVDTFPKKRIFQTENVFFEYPKAGFVVKTTAFSPAWDNKSIQINQRIQYAPFFNKGFSKYVRVSTQRPTSIGYEKTFKKGKKITKSSYDHAKAQTFSYYFFNDSEGNKREMFNAQDELIITNRYEYDAKGNWIKRAAYRSAALDFSMRPDTFFYSRILTYY
jgi:hypothetical protein